MAAMGKPPKNRVQGGRVTPKGGGSSASSTSSGSTEPRVSKRVTPKGTRPEGEKVLSTASYYQSGQKISPTWVPVLMFAFLIIGSLMIILNYVDLLPGGTSNWYLLGGLGLILAGIVTATQYH